MGRWFPRTDARPPPWRNQVRHHHQRDFLAGGLDAHLLAAAGVTDVVEELKQGYEANSKTWTLHADGYNFLPYFQGEAKKGPREEIIYFRPRRQHERRALENFGGD